MNTVTLQFQTNNLLWAFARTLKVQQFKIDTKKIQITCKCEEIHLAEALIIFKAKLIADPLTPDIK